MTYKIINKSCPENLFDKYLPRSFFFRTIRDILRSQDAGQNLSKSFNCASLKVRNDRSSTIRELPTLNRFKQRLKTQSKGLDSF